MPRNYDSSRRGAAAGRNRAAIIQACRELLFRYGYQATTIKAVAERAQVSPETIYKGFGGKSGLMKALWDVTLAGDDEPVAMGERPALREVWATTDPYRKIRLYAVFVRGVHERVAVLFAVLRNAGPEVAEVLAIADRERLAGVSAFVTHLEKNGRAADSCWVLTSTAIYVQFTHERGWDADAYENWLAEILSATLIDEAAK